MSPVFGHGMLRLYLLKLLDEHPRHGYEVIRLLEDRFLGLYAPSAGTVYPRLARLECEGLVTHAVEDGRKVYRLTDAGREELRRREDELSALEASIRSSVTDLAQEIREEVRGSVRNLREELRQAAREVRGQDRHQAREERRNPGQPRWTARELEQLVELFRRQARELARQAPVTEEQVRDCRALLDDALTGIQNVLRNAHGDGKRE
jgi:DNA-binding PadR family transcriptional regulator